MTKPQQLRTVAVVSLDFLKTEVAQSAQRDTIIEALQEVLAQAPGEVTNKERRYTGPRKFPPNQSRPLED